MRCCLDFISAGQVAPRRFLAALAFDERLWDSGTAARKIAREEALHVDGAHFLASDIHFFLAAPQAAQDLRRALFGGHSLGLALVHFSVPAAVAHQGMQADVRSNEAGADQRHLDSMAALLGP